MNTIDRYIASRANTTIAVVVVSLLALISLFALFEELDERQVTYGLSEALQYVLMTLPRRLDEILVYGVFLGFLIALGYFAESNELTVCRVSGMSPARLCLALMPSLLLWLAISIVVAEFIAPVSERAAEVNKLEAQFGNDALNNAGGLWLRDANTYMQVRAIDEQGHLLGINQYVLNESRELVESLTAESGIYNEELGQWILLNGRRTELGTDVAYTAEFERWTWNNPITPTVLASQAFLEPNKMSMRALYDQIQFSRAQNFGTSEHELAFWSRALKPVTYFGLMLFALGVVMGPLREVGVGLRITVGIFAGLGFKYLQDLFAPGAMVFNIPAIIAILIPIAGYWLVAWVLIRKNA